MWIVKGAHVTILPDKTATNSLVLLPLRGEVFVPCPWFWLGSVTKVLAACPSGLGRLTLAVYPLGSPSAMM